MKKRLLTLVMAGVMLTGVMAPAAMAADTGNATVTYVAGAGTPGGSDGSYYVLFPADLTFYEKSDTPKHKVELKATTGNASDLAKDLSVNVNIKGEGELSNTTYSADKISYEIDYTDAQLNESSKEVDLTLTPAQTSKEGTGKITEMTLPNVAKGTAFTDTLTFTLKQTSPVVGP